nr:unnamed protein product [Callosobruchus chinensis]
MPQVCRIKNKCSTIQINSTFRELSSMIQISSMKAMIQINMIPTSMTLVSTIRLNINSMKVTNSIKKNNMLRKKLIRIRVILQLSRKGIWLQNRNLCRS